MEKSHPRSLQLERTRHRILSMSIQLPDFTPHLDERLSAEFLACSLALLPISTHQSDDVLDATALRLARPEAPRDPDLPLLPQKNYPRLSESAVESAIRSLQPPPPLADFAGRKAEMDRVVMALQGGHPVVLLGNRSSGKTAVLRALANDPRVRQQFRRIWWLDDLENAANVLGTALEAPHVLMGELADQPRRLQEFLVESNVLLLVDSVANSGMLDGMDWILRCSSALVVADLRDSKDVPALEPAPTVVSLPELPTNAAAALLMGLTGLPEAVAEPLAGLVFQHPGAILVLAALLTEDNVPPETLVSLLRDAPPNASARMNALYTASFEALPDSYQALCRVLAATPRRWIAVESILAHYDKPLAGQRALDYIERRRFIERRENAVRVIGSWPDLVPAATEETELPTIGQNIDTYRIATTDGAIFQAETLYQQGVRAIDECRDTDALNALDAALTIRKQRGTRYEVAEVLAALGRLAYLRGEDAEACRHLENAAQHLHDLHDEDGLEIARLALSRVYRRAGRLDAALSVLDDNAPPADLAAVYRAREDWSAALAVYERWLGQAGDDIELAKLGRAETFILAGRFADALAAVSQEDGFVGNWIRAIVYHMQGDFPKALSAYAQAQADTPTDWRATVSRAMARAMAAAGQIREAAMLVGAEGIWYETRFDRPVFARQRLSQALYAQLSFMTGDYSIAEEAARTAHSIVGERPDSEAEAIACRVLGRLEWRNKEYSAAVHAFESELTARNAFDNRDDHEIGVTLHNLADVQRAAGERERAIANYRRALTHKDANRDRFSVAQTYLALCECLIEAGRNMEALEAGNPLIALLGRPPEADLQLLGYTLTLNATTQIEAGRGPRGSVLLVDWMTRLAARADEALAHSHWALPVLATGLYLRSAGAPEGDYGSLEPLALIDLAENALNAAERELPKSWTAAAARRDLGELYVRLERWSDAVEVLAPLVQDEENSADNTRFVRLAAHLSSARALMHLDNQTDMLAHYERAADAEPDTHARGLILRESAEASRTLGNDEQAVALYPRALGLIRKEKDLAAYVDTVVALAYARLRLRRFSEAIDTFEEALATVEKDPSGKGLAASVLFDMANAHSTLGQYRRAAETFRRSLGYQDRSQAARYAETLIALARSEANTGGHQRAVEAYHDALQFETLTPDVRRTLFTEQADALVHLDQLQPAINAYDSALAIEGGQTVEVAAIHRGLGTIYTRLGDHGRAREHFQQALEAVQDDLTGATLQALADSYRAQGQIKEATDTYHRALNFLDKRTASLERAAAERALGELYLEGRKLSNAILHLEAALDLERATPQQRGGRIVSILQSLAYAHELRGELDKAAVRHHEALVYQDVRHAPQEYVETLRTLGRLYLEMKRTGEAARAFEEALRVEGQQRRPDPDKIDAITVALANVRRAQGMLEQSAELYRRVAASPQGSPARKQATDALESVTAEINKHLQTLEAAEQSMLLFKRTANPDMKGMAFIRALQAQTCDALGRKEASERQIRDLLNMLLKRKKELSSVEPVMQALAYLAEGWEFEQDGDSPLAAKSYHSALEIVEQDGKGNPALLWVIRAKTSPSANT